MIAAGDKSHHHDLALLVAGIIGAAIGIYQRHQDQVSVSSKQTVAATATIQSSSAPAPQMSAPLTRYVIKFDEDAAMKALPAGEQLRFQPGYEYWKEGQFDLVELDLPVGYTIDNTSGWEDQQRLCHSKHVSKESQVQEIVLCWNTSPYFIQPFAIRKLP